jgi:hypothetical protein
MSQLPYLKRNTPWTESERNQMRRFILRETADEVISGYLAGNTTLMDFDDYLDRYYQLPLQPTLTGADRCDRCGGRAVIVARINGTDLLFCGHHSREYANVLAPYTTNVPHLER